MPESSKNNGLTNSGQLGSNSGQKLSNVGQLLGMRSGAAVEERTGNGQTMSNAGQNLALKWPKKDPERFSSVLKLTLLSELQEVVEAWEELPQALKEGILAIVRGAAEKSEISEKRSRFDGTDVRIEYRAYAYTLA